MNEIAWNAKSHSILNQATTLMRDGNKMLDLSDKAIWGLASTVGYEINERMDRACFLNVFDDYEYSGNYAATLNAWVASGFILDEFKEWAAPQLMAAFAAYLVADAEDMLDDLPEPGRKVTLNGVGWRRDQIIEHSAGNLIEALEACYFGRQLIGQEIKPDPEKLAELMRQHNESRAKHANAHRSEQLLKPDWEAHCRRALADGHCIDYLPDLLNIPGYDHAIARIQPATLRKWAKSIGIAFKSGRPKSV